MIFNSVVLFLLCKHLHHPSPERERNLTFSNILPFAKKMSSQHRSCWEEVKSLRGCLRPVLSQRPPLSSTVPTGTTETKTTLATPSSCPSLLWGPRCHLGDRLGLAEMFLAILTISWKHQVLTGSVGGRGSRAKASITGSAPAGWGPQSGLTVESWALRAEPWMTKR